MKASDLTGDPERDGVLISLATFVRNHEEWNRRTSEEIAACNAFADSRPATDQFARRTVVRTVFSLVELWVDHAGRAAVDFARINGTSLNEEDVLGFQEKIMKEGKPVSCRFSLKDRVKFAHRCTVQAIGNRCKLDFGSRDGQKFLKAIEIRDRITHPRRGRDWDITEDEMKLVREGWEWLGKQLSDATAFPKEDAEAG